MEIAILGANGFVGSNLVKILKSYYKVYSITSENYTNFIGLKFDVLINANGNGKKYLAEDKPLLDFDLSVKSVYNSLFDFEFKTYIYISSIDVYKESMYGFHRSVAEDIIRQISEKKQFNCINFRCGSIIGPGLKKGVLYDIINNIPLHISPKSRLQFISIREIVNTIIYFLNHKEDNNIITLDVFSPQPISIKSIGKLVGKKVRYIPGDLPIQDYNNAAWLTIDEPYKYKSSKHYVKEYIEKCQKLI